MGDRQSIREPPRERQVGAPGGAGAGRSSIV